MVVCCALGREVIRSSQVAGWLTPAPGGVGPMTVAVLLQNTVTAAKRQAGLAA